jgi:hypothetical protein
MKLHTFTQLGILTATSVLAFIGGIITADLHKAEPRQETVTTAPVSHPLPQLPQAEPEAPRLRLLLDEARAEVLAAQALSETERATVARLRLEQKTLEGNLVVARRDIAALTQDRADWVRIATDWQKAAERATASQGQSLAQTVPTAAQPNNAANTQPHLLTPLHRALHDEPVEDPRSKTRTAHIIDTGYGTATVINPDGTRSYVQSTGEGTATVITPGR